MHEIASDNYSRQVLLSELKKSSMGNDSRSST